MTELQACKEVFESKFKVSWFFELLAFGGLGYAWPRWFRAYRVHQWTHITA